MVLLSIWAATIIFFWSIFGSELNSGYIQFAGPAQSSLYSLENTNCVLCRPVIPSFIASIGLIWDDHRIIRIARNVHRPWISVDLKIPSGRDASIETGGQLREDTLNLLLRRQTSLHDENYSTVVLILKKYYLDVIRADTNQLFSLEY